MEATYLNHKIMNAIDPTSNSYSVIDHPIFGQNDPHLTIALLKTPGPKHVYN